MDSGNRSGPRRLGWLSLGLCLACLAGCVSIQIGSNDPPPPSSMRMQQPVTRPESVPPSLQQVSHAAPPLASPMPAGTSFPGAAYPGSMGGPGLTVSAAPPLSGPPPTEINPRSLPPYMVEPPDILLLDTVRLVPKPPYVVSALDVLLVRVDEPLPNQPVEGTYTVAPDGTINLGYSYGVARVGGLTLDQVERVIREQLSRSIKNPKIAVGLAQFRGVQQVRGEHLVRPDGTINLGSYGCVYVVGLTLPEIKVAVERHLAQYVLDPEINVDVLAYNSKVYYVITDGAGFGQRVYRFPITGKEYVLDAISNVVGLPAVASKKKIWVARPAPACNPCVQVLPVDWRAITESGATGTNYQLFPGDRVYVGPDPWIRADNALAKLFGPLERVLGLTLLGSSAYNNVRAAATGTGNGVGTSFFAPLR